MSVLVVGANAVPRLTASYDRLAQDSTNPAVTHKCQVTNMVKLRWRMMNKQLAMQQKWLTQVLPYISLNGAMTNGATAKLNKKMERVMEIMVGLVMP
jgi:hypothetical protein